MYAPWLVCSKTWPGGKSAQNAMKIGRSRRIIALIKLLKSVCPKLSLLCHYGGARQKIDTQEEMYYKDLSDRPRINYTLYNMHRANKTAYSDLPESQHFGVIRKIPVQNMVNKEKCFVKAIWNRTL